MGCAQDTVVTDSEGDVLKPGQSLHIDSKAGGKQVKSGHGGGDEHYEPNEAQQKMMDHLGAFDGGQQNGETLNVHTVVKDNRAYIGQEENEVAHGFGKETNFEGLRYVGQYHEGKFHGYGRLIDVNGNGYQGEFHDGQPHGNGKFTFADLADEFEGEFSHGVMCDQGPTEEEHEDVTHFTLDSKALVRHAELGGDFDYSKCGQNTCLPRHGPCNRDNKSVYEGQYFNHHPHGQGKCTYNDGSIYEGEFKSGVKSGYGRNVNSNGNCYEGTWLDGVYNGQGVFSRLDGLVYEGDMVNGGREGLGKLTYPDEKTYDGGWKDGKMDGYGTFTWPDGKCYEGNYVANKKHGFGKYTFKDGSTYEGEFGDGKQHGKGLRRGKYYKYENGVKGEECSEDHDHEEEDEHVHEEGGSHHEDEEELLA